MSILINNSSDRAKGALTFDGSTSQYVLVNPFSGFPTQEITAAC